MITVLANQLVNKNKITIVTHDLPEEEDRAMYGLDKRIQVEFLDLNNFRYEKGSAAGYLNRFQLKINNKTGRYNKDEKLEKLKNIVMPQKFQDRWVEYYNSKDYDVIIATAGNALYLAFIADRLKAKTVGWQHNDYNTYVNQPGILFWKKEKLIKYYFSKLDKYVVLNDYDKFEFKKNLDFDCVAMGNPRSFVSEQKTDLSQKQFFAAGRFVEQKGFKLMIKAFAEFCKVDDEWNLTIAGDGKLRKSILDEVWKNNLQERVHFIGMTNNVQKYYLQSSIYLLSSKWEGWGLVVIEAFEMGMPVIAFDITPMDLLITNGEDGLIVPQFDYYAFAAAMVKIAHDDKLRESMGKKAIETAKLYSEERIASEWQTLLESLDADGH